MRMGNFGQMGEYGPCADVNHVATFGIFPAAAAGMMAGQEVATFTLKVRSGASRYPKADKKLAEWCAANGHDAADYKVLLIMA